MYNRYIPNGTTYTRVAQPDGPGFLPVMPVEPPPTQSPPNPGPQPSTKPPGNLGGIPKFPWLTDLLASFKLDSLDAGDILLLLILLFIFIDGDDLELVITLGLLLLFGLGDRGQEEPIGP